MTQNKSYDDILKNIKNVSGEPIINSKEKEIKPKKLKPFHLIITAVVIFLSTVTALYFLYDLFIRPCSTHLPNISWITMLCSFIFYHIFTLRIFSFFSGKKVSQ